MNACKKCSMKCLLTHGKRDGLDPVVKSFIKVMIHDRFSNVLFIPPRFAPELASLVNKEIQVEDTSGRHWTVGLSYVNGNLAFRRGWNAFVSDQGIKFGDMVIVHYILGSNFVVQIYGKNGCEKLEFPCASHNARNKRAKTFRSFVDNGSTTSSDAGVNVNTVQGNKKGSSKAHLSDSSRKKGEKIQFFEDPCCIINRDIASPPVVDTRCFIDLSELEMCKTKPVCENGSLPMLGYGLTDHTEREEQISEPSFYEENIIDYGAFQSAMEIPYDSQANDSLKHGEISGQILLESRPFMSSINATEHKMKHVDVSSGPSREAQANDSLKHGEISGQILLESRSSTAVSATENKMKHADGYAGPSREAQTASFKAQAGTLGVQTTTLRGQGAVKVRDEINPKGFGASASVRIAKKENNNFNPEELFGGSAKIVKNDHREVNPKSFGGSAKIVKKEFSPKCSGGGVRIVKKEFIEDNNPQNFGKKCNANGSLQENGASVSGPLLKEVKAEVIDLAEPPSPLAVTCLVASDDSFLEIPVNFFLSRYRGRMELEEERVLLLRDSAGKQWPVFYHKKTGMKAITGGWREFREANGIRVGDECVFELKDELESIYQVYVIHK